MRIAIVSCVLGLTACVSSSTGDGDGALAKDDVAETSEDGDDPPDGEGSDRPPHPPYERMEGDECKVEDGEVGKVDVPIPTPAGEVRIVSWTAKAGSPGEYVGFTLSRSAHFVVKAGTETWTAEGTSWTNPYGDSGPRAHGISHIDFCEDYCHEYPPEPGDGGDGGDGDGGGDGDVPPVD